MADNDVKKIPVTSAATTPAVNEAAGPLDAVEDEYSDIKKELATRFELLPEDLKKVIVDDNYQMRLFNIAKAQKLTYEELGILEMETTMVLLGMIKPSDYRDEVQVQLKKNDPEIDALITAVNNEVFSPIRSSLDALYANKKEPQDFLPPNIDIMTGKPVVKEEAPVVKEPTPFPAPAPATPTKVAAVNPIPTPSLTTAEKNVLEKTGVVISETPAPATPTPVAPVPTRGDVLKGIENPPKSSSYGSIVADKLKSAGPVISATKTTDYTVAKTATPATSTPPVAKSPAADPYREPIN